MIKRVISVSILIALILVAFISGYRASKYYETSNTTDNVSASIARWSFDSENAGTEIKLSDEKIFPGSNGQFEIEVDASNSEVEVEYEILVTEEKNIPHNMNFFAKTQDEQGGELKETEKYNSFTELAQKELRGKIPIQINNQKRKIIIFWSWEFNESNSSVDVSDATLLYDENGNSSLDCGFSIQIIGKQAN